MKQHSILSENSEHHWPYLDTKDKILLENNELAPWVIERLEPYIFNKHIN